MPIKVAAAAQATKYLSNTENASNSPDTHIPLTTATMPKPRRNLQATAEETMTPPPSLTPTQSVARVQQAAGNNLYRIELPDTKVLLVELPARFRSTIWIKRGGFVLVDTGAMNERENKLDGEIINVVRNEKEWRKQKYWYVVCWVWWAGMKSADFVSTGLRNSCRGFLMLMRMTLMKKSLMLEKCLLRILKTSDCATHLRNRQIPTG
jgi:probable RNA-binding protein EIF1AD